MVGQRPGQAIASEHFTLPGIWKDTCRAHGPNGMCLVHDYPFYECALMVWRMHATIKGLTRVTILRTDDKYWRDQAHARWIAARDRKKFFHDGYRRFGRLRTRTLNLPFRFLHTGATCARETAFALGEKL